MNEFKNVREPWEMHDTLCICNSLYGSEANAGYFTTFNAFGQQSEHLMFKRRSEGNVHRAYNNQQSEDRTDFVFHIFAIGLLFQAPTTLDARYSGDPVVPSHYQQYLPAFWTGELPRHCSASLVVGQDTKVDLQAMMMSPGYGPQTSGVGSGLDTLAAESPTPEMVWTGMQGVPIPSVRYWLATGGNDPKPIGVPKGELLEVKIKVSEYARNLLTAAGGPYSYAQGEEAVYTYFNTRYYIQASLWGYREVQQRGQLRAG